MTSRHVRERGTCASAGAGGSVGVRGGDCGSVSAGVSASVSDSDSAGAKQDGSGAWRLVPAGANPVP